MRGFSPFFSSTVPLSGSSHFPSIGNVSFLLFPGNVLLSQSDVHGFIFPRKQPWGTFCAEQN